MCHDVEMLQGLRPGRGQCIVVVGTLAARGFTPAAKGGLIALLDVARV